MHVNGKTALLGQKADPEVDEITVDGRPLTQEGQKRYLMLNKPRGYVCTLSDELGEWMQHLLHPRYEVNKVYEVSVAGEVRGAAEALASMTQLDGEPIRPAQVRVLRQGRDTALLSITIHEGKNRQIRRMCATAGLHVKRLKRVQEHAFKLGALPVGVWRDLTEQELHATKSK